MKPRSPSPEQYQAAAEWCLQLAEGPLPDETQRAFDAWLDAHPDHLVAFERSSSLWRQMGEAAASPELVDVRERALATFRRRNQWRWARRAVGGHAVAAAAAMLLALAGGAWWWQSAPDIYRTGVGERRVVMLDDGSRASLDAATEVDVRMRGDRRELHLVSGRAKFDVAKDPLKPFSVRVGEKLVVAIGTSFSVEMINGKLRVILYEGRVAVLDRPEGTASAAEVLPALKGGGEEAVLTPGRELVVGMTGGAAAQLSRADPVRSLSWEGGQLVFDDEPLGLAVGRINRYSARRVELKGAAGRMRVNGVFNTGDVEAFATGVEETLPVRVTRERDVVTISPQ
ncbi:FecR domain-containing protein [Sphingomonas sp. MG17]|uniref:FecR domain-containing protein n=1 Tax=Sphingomonas tagetis TaxID=2949092 RepID=A0A9X2HNN6_9SPHN|nr:FecR domain-containing protein [Sphingomonas tagetis]MCP3732982.1 FecR domain-containing protein [Sphingomonas tagetis]